MVQRTAVKRDAWLTEAVRYVAYGHWDTAAAWDDGISAKLRAAQDIRQRARDGKLTIWGRDWPNSGIFNPIEADYWAHYTFDQEEVLKDEPGNLSSKAESGSGFVPPGVQYALQTSRAQIEKLWPEKFPNGRPEVVPIWRAIAHVRQTLNDTNEDEAFPATRRELRQAALDGRIHIHGHKSDLPMGAGRNYSAVSTLIPQTYWEKADFSALATDPQFADRFDCLTFPHQMSGGKYGEDIELYAKCTLNWHEVLKEWP